ncbi:MULTISPECIES: bifunctional folylpolyglutamate synthase/dihydrofolate synthase [Oceanobacillus]|uniref:tetrahydrofolate synthase n=1 Tax=Oceanobacillus aidingensis TaxID=645964 RepID=A0ABV9K2E0_9BACI|nr:folylpolyglutamate synthase/dihydrofolate synthase family protein [Oceanobacillus oncorhynchi]MDM8100466.1 folylpolyglutamate synthase/dihydrofolate synthase family protein [Oceanobacillus oncorhynchi]
MRTNIHEFFEKRQKLGVQPGLDRIEALLEALDHPEKKFTSVHIAGTNGKGSTGAFLQAALRANRYRIGTFTSPSLNGLTGFILYNGEFISEDVFAELFEEIEPVIEQMDREGKPPSHFEIMTAMAFLYFSRNVDIAIIEAGMGGRDDTTNVIQPVLSIITTVSKDHTAFLGDTLVEIAAHKAGIIKPHTPIITGVEGEALTPIVNEANKNRAVLYRFGMDFTMENIQIDEFEWKNLGSRYRVKLRTIGLHQHHNASVAIQALKVLKNRFGHLDMHTSIEAIQKVTIPGRMEKIHDNPFILVDGAHNEAGVRAFIKTVRAIYPRRKVHVLFAAFKDKDIEEMQRLLADVFPNLYITSFDHPRAAALTDYPLQDKGEQVEDWQAWMKEKIKTSMAPILITGSFHFVDYIRSFVKSLEASE